MVIRRTFGGYIQENHCAVQEAFESSVEEWARIATDSILGSWCGEDRKDEPLKGLADTGEIYREVR